MTNFMTKFMTKNAKSSGFKAKTIAFNIKTKKAENPRKYKAFDYFITCDFENKKSG